MPNSSCTEPSPGERRFNRFYASAFRRRDRSLLQLVLDNSPEKRTIQFLNQTFALHRAAKIGWLDGLQILIGYGVDRHAVDEEGYSALVYAIGSDNPPSIDYLVEQGLPMDTHYGPYQWSLLHIAVFKHRPKALEALLALNCDPNAEDDIKGTVAHYAAFHDDVNTLQALSEKGANFDKCANGHTPLIWAILYKKERAAIWLIKAGVDLTISQYKDRGPLHLAAYKGLKRTVKTLLAKGLNINQMTQHGLTPIFLAVEANLPNMVTFLLAQGASVDYEFEGRKKSVLHLAAKHGRIAILKALVNLKIDLTLTSNKGLTAVEEALLAGQLESAHYLYQQGSLLSSTTLSGRSKVIRHLVVNGQLESLNFLKEQGVTFNNSAGENETYLQVAAEHGKEEVVKAFLQWGAVGDETDKIGRTALHRAIKGGHWPWFKFC